MKVTRSMSATFEPYAECADDACGWEAASSHVARERAKGHVRSTGHHVRVVAEKVDLYVREES